MQHEYDTALAQPMIGRRQCSRLRTNLPVKITSLYLTAHGHLLNLSLTGANFAVPRLIPHGIEVLLQWSGSVVLGEIAWVEHRHCGVRFTDPIAAEALLLARTTGGPIPLGRTQELAAEFARERDYRNQRIASYEQGADAPAVLHGGRFGLRRI